MLVYRGLRCLLLKAIRFPSEPESGFSAKLNLHSLIKYSPLISGLVHAEGLQRTSLLVYQV